MYIPISATWWENNGIFNICDRLSGCHHRHRRMRSLRWSHQFGAGLRIRGAAVLHLPLVRHVTRRTLGAFLNSRHPKSSKWPCYQYPVITSSCETSTCWFGVSFLVCFRLIVCSICLFSLVTRIHHLFNNASASVLDMDDTWDPEWIIPKHQPLEASKKLDEIDHDLTTWRTGLFRYEESFQWPNFSGIFRG